MAIIFFWFRRILYNYSVLNCKQQQQLNSKWKRFIPQRPMAFVEQLVLCWVGRPRGVGGSRTKRVLLTQFQGPKLLHVGWESQWVEYFPVVSLSWSTLVGKATVSCKHVSAQGFSLMLIQGSLYVQTYTMPILTLCNRCKTNLYHALNPKTCM